MIHTSLKQLWENYSQPENEQILASLDILATGLVSQSARVKQHQKLLIWLDKPGIYLGRLLVEKSLAIGAEIKIFIRDYEADAHNLNSLEINKISEMFTLEAELMSWAENIILIRNPENPEAMNTVPLASAVEYQTQFADIHDRRTRGEVLWTLFRYPTEYEAVKENLSSQAYLNLVVKACDQPWDEIEVAQEKLKNMLDQGNKLEFYANENDPGPNRRTAVSMSIKDMTFCNSTIFRNYPGSEVFSAPVLDSVNGQVFAEGEFLYDSFLMKDLSMHIKNGRVVTAHAQEGDKEFQTILDRNDSIDGQGSRYFGEVALGTNQGLTKKLFNPLLAEKVGGSFHLAIGHCYTLTEYKGKPVRVNNGNTTETTPIHWDITILMHPKHDGTGGGRVVLDGEVIQENGQFIDPDLKILGLPISTK